MRKLLLLSSLMTIIISCSPKVYPVQSCVIVSEQNNTITLRATGFGKHKIESLDAAEKNALESILFRGIPGSQYNNPLISLREDQALQANPRYFKELFEKGRHKSFIISSVPVTNYSWTKYKKWTITADITVNIFALRKDLEQNGIIRKFGL
ncbi:MAG: hypothetical protein IKZ50_00835 [Bacteroidales bacterium]|nr:hypothetical protein [Bacteroidales bacterium]